MASPNTLQSHRTPFKMYTKKGRPTQRLLQRKLRELWLKKLLAKRAAR